MTRCLTPTIEPYQGTRVARRKRLDSLVTVAQHFKQLGSDSYYYLGIYAQLHYVTPISNGCPLKSLPMPQPLRAVFRSSPYAPRRE